VRVTTVVIIPKLKDNVMSIISKTTIFISHYSHHKKTNNYNSIQDSSVETYCTHSRTKKTNIAMHYFYKMIPIHTDIINGFVSHSKISKIKLAISSPLSTFAKNILFIRKEWKYQYFLSSMLTKIMEMDGRKWAITSNTKNQISYKITTQN
jgi:hypothetical protein